MDRHGLLERESFTKGVASQITPNKLLLRANLTASLIDVHLLSSSWNSGSGVDKADVVVLAGTVGAAEAVAVVALESKGDPCLLETPEPCLGEGRESGSTGSLRLRLVGSDDAESRMEREARVDERALL